MVCGALTFAAQSGGVPVLAGRKANSDGLTTMAGFLEAHAMGFDGILRLIPRVLSKGAPCVSGSPGLPGL